MFKSQTVRVFSAILLCSVAGVFWGAFYHANHWEAMARGGELDKMIDLLACIMFGSGGGIVIGTLIGTARLRWPVLLVTLIGVAATLFMPPGLGLFTITSVDMTFLMSQVVVLALVLLTSLVLRMTRPRTPNSEVSP